MTFLLVGFLLVICTIMVYLFYKVRGAYIPKIICTVLMLYIASSVYFSFESYMGWPVMYKPGIIQGALVVNVIQAGDDHDGAIYVTAIPCAKVEDCFSVVQEKDTSFFTAWLSPYKVFGYAPDRQLTPRIYQFPYNQQTRKMFSQAQEAMQEGKSVYLKERKGELTAGTDEDNTDGEQSGSTKKGKSNGPDNSENGYIEGLPDLQLNFVDPFKGVTK